MESLGERVNIRCLEYFFIACKHGTRQHCSLQSSAWEKLFHKQTYFWYIFHQDDCQNTSGFISFPKIPTSHLSFSWFRGYSFWEPANTSLLALLHDVQVPVGRLGQNLFVLGAGNNTGVQFQIRFSLSMCIWPRFMTFSSSQREGKRRATSPTFCTLLLVQKVKTYSSRMYPFSVQKELENYVMT